MQLLRTILIIIIAYYLIKLFMRYVMPLLLRYFIRKSQKQYQQTEQRQRKNGEIHIDYTQEKKGSTDSLGEYVDYEEINDEKSNASKS
ncbi:MAG: DUF4834 family protein [Bacteroidetes bacterium]|nr:DUF4834 family protein [Bacteroidota bacterium]